jgi:hypothetical protein
MDIGIMLSFLPETLLLRMDLNLLIFLLLLAAVAVDLRHLEMDLVVVGQEEYRFFQI